MFYGLKHQYLMLRWVLNNIIKHKNSTELEYFCYFRLYDESPRWYLSKGNMKKCREVLRRITTTNGHNLDDLNLKVTLLSFYTHLYMCFGQSYYNACMCETVHNTQYYLHYNQTVLCSLYGTFSEGKVTWVNPCMPNALPAQSHAPLTCIITPLITVFVLVHMCSSFSIRVSMLAAIAN